MKKLSFVFILLSVAFISCNKEKAIELTNKNSKSIQFNESDAKDLYSSLFFGNGTYVSKIASLNKYVLQNQTLLQKKAVQTQEKIFTSLKAAHPEFLHTFYTNIKSNNYELIKTELTQNQLLLSEILVANFNVQPSNTNERVNSGIVTYPVIIDCVSKNVTFYDCTKANQVLDCVKYGSSTIYSATGRISGDCINFHSFSNISNTTNQSLIDCTVISSFVADCLAYSRTASTSATKNPTTLEFYRLQMDSNLKSDMFIHELISALSNK